MELLQEATEWFCLHGAVAGGNGVGVVCKELLQVATWLVFVRSCCRWQHGWFLFAGSYCKRQQSWFLHISWSQGVTELWKFVAAHWVKWQHRLFSMSGGTGVYHEFAAELVVLGFVAGGRGMGLLWYWTIELVENDLEGATDLVASAVLRGVTYLVACETESVTQEFVAVGDRTGFAGVFSCEG